MTTQPDSLGTADIVSRRTGMAGLAVCLDTAVIHSGYRRKRCRAHMT